MTISGEINQKSPGGDEEEEIAPPEDIKDEPKEVKIAVVDQHECPKCAKTFSKVSLLNRHMKVHSGVKPFGCTVCGVRFLQKYNLNKHLLIHENSKQNKRGQSKPVLPEENKLKHTTQKSAADDQQAPETITAKPVQKATARKSQFSSFSSNPGITTSSPQPALSNASQSVAKHNDTVEIMNAVMQLAGHTFSCPNCDKDFSSKIELEKHLPFHRKLEKPYSCVVCGWRFHLLNNMQRHMMTHTAMDKNKNK